MIQSQKVFKLIIFDIDNYVDGGVLKVAKECHVLVKRPLTRCLKLDEATLEMCSTISR